LAAAPTKSIIKRYVHKEIKIIELNKKGYCFFGVQSRIKSILQLVSFSLDNPFQWLVTFPIKTAE
jgi:hypothetical protein